jgi:Bardet-Biedl syndrome 4 protein
MSTARERRNWLIYELYSHRRFEECERLVEEQLRAARGASEYALYVKGLLRRQQGAISESLLLFQAAACLNPRSVTNLKQVGRSLFLLGKHRAALDVLGEAERLAPEDWQLPHARGVAQTAHRRVVSRSRLYVLLPRRCVISFACRRRHY